MIELAPACGLLAGAVGIADTVPYVRDTLRGATRPHRATWLIWGVLAVVVCASQYADGASWSLVMAAVQVVLTLGIFALSIRWGEGGLSAHERLLVATAGAGVVGWLVADEPVVATVFVIAADLTGAALMIPKTYRDPRSETLSTYVLAAVGGGLAAGAVGAIDVSLLAYPVYYLLVNGALASLIALRRAAMGPFLHNMHSAPG
jgi:hypothetical protein